MKQSLLVMLVLTFTYSLSACAKSTPPNVSAQTSSVEDQASFLAALQAEGAKTEVGDPLAQGFFTVNGRTVKVNGVDLQVYEYESAAAMEKDAAQVAPDGGSVGTSMPMWIDKPHFYKAGRILVLYLGTDQKILDLLNKVLGSQFAGQ